jgi:sulfate transport system ATP-binding protein
VQDGKARLGPIVVPFPEHPHEDARDAAGYARPHELDVGRTEEDGGGLWAIVTDVRAVGALVKMEVEGADRRIMQIELGREQYEQVRVITGDRVYVKPRKVRVFVNG